MMRSSCSFRCQAAPPQVRGHPVLVAARSAARQTFQRLQVAPSSRHPMPYQRIWATQPVEHKFNADYGLSRGRTYSADEEDVEVILEDHTDEEKKTEGKTMLASCAVQHSIYIGYRRYRFEHQKPMIHRQAYHMNTITLEQNRATCTEDQFHRRLPCSE